ncbi:MAG: molybdenum cofactor guanylyltransferase [Bacteroidales bacterium]|nr:molybdenum cofactor guanylyltransferase [Bacteroidales bacterium]
MKTSSTKITGILLAGGKSRRMGVEKGTLVIGGALLYQHPLKVLEGLCDEILISSYSDSISRVPHRKVCDEIKGIGPLGGIFSCLKQSSSDLNLVLSYDLPLVNESLFRLLISERDRYDLVLPAMPGKQAEPLCGLYHKNVLEVIGQMIRQKDYKVNHLLDRCPSRVVPITRDMKCWQTDLFLNINSKEDLQRLPPGFKTD